MNWMISQGKGNRKCIIYRQVEPNVSGKGEGERSEAKGRIEERSN